METLLILLAIYLTFKVVLFIMKLDFCEFDTKREALVYWIPFYSTYQKFKDLQ